MILESKTGAKDLEILGAYEGLLNNVEIVGKSDKIDFKAFLEGEKNTVAINNWKDSYIVYFKTNLTDNLTLIYHQRYSKYPFYNAIKDEKVNMIYNNINNTLYTIGYEYGQNVLELEGLKVLSISEFGNNLENEINERIIKIVNNDVNNLNLSDEELDEYNKYILEGNEDYKEYKSCAINYYTGDKDVNLNSYASFEFDKRCYYSCDRNISDYYIGFEGLNIIKAINNKDAFINEHVNTIVSKYKKSLYVTIFKNNKIVEFMNELKQDNTLNTVREIQSILNSENMKTFNINYKKDGKEMTFKIEGNTHIYSCGGYHISTYSICNRKDRDTFEDLFKVDRWRETNIYLNNIESITYGRKVLYKK